MDVFEIVSLGVIAIVSIIISSVSKKSPDKGKRIEKIIMLTVTILFIVFSIVFILQDKIDLYMFLPTLGIILPLLLFEIIPNNIKLIKYIGYGITTIFLIAFCSEVVIRLMAINNIELLPLLDISKGYSIQNLTGNTFLACITYWIFYVIQKAKL